MEAFLVIYVGLVIWVIVICVQKGKAGMAWLGLLTGWTVVIGAVRIAKPNSTWARKNYPPGGQKMALAMARFPGSSVRARTSVADDLTGVATPQPGQDAEAQTEAIEAEVSKLRDLAESKDWKFRVVSRSASRVVFKTRQPGFVWRRAAVHVVDDTVSVTDL